MIQPRFKIGKLKVGLYLPIIYQNDMFDPDDWYRPDGQRRVELRHRPVRLGRGRHGLRSNDLFLKIRYIEWGEQRDPFFFKFGNLGDLTMGHGSIMRHYANDLDFPSVRKLGLNLGLDGKKGGLEAMISDAAEPQLFGIRPYWKPGGGQVRPGVHGPDRPEPRAGGLRRTTAARLGKPIFLNAGLDLELSIVEGKGLSIVPYVDGAVMLPFFREPVGQRGRRASPWTRLERRRAAQLRGHGRRAGQHPVHRLPPGVPLLGRRLPAGLLWAAVRPGEPGPRGRDAELPERPDDQAYDVQTMGVYGELGFTLERVFYIAGGYYWPWPVDPADRGQRAGSMTRCTWSWAS